MEYKLGSVQTLYNVRYVELEWHQIFVFLIDSGMKNNLRPISNVLYGCFRECFASLSATVLRTYLTVCEWLNT